MARLYAASHDDTNSSYVIQIDTTSSNITTILGGGSSKFPPVSQGVDPAVHGITNDGKNLIVAGDGFVWYLTISGTSRCSRARKTRIDYLPDRLRPDAAHPAMQLALPTAIGTSNEHGSGAFNHIVYNSGAIYYRGFADGSSAFIERIACP